MQQKVAAVAILSAISALTVAVLYVPATVPSPAATPAALAIPDSGVPRLGRFAPRRGGPDSRVPGSKVPGSGVPRLGRFAPRRGEPDSRVPGSKVPGSQVRGSWVPGSWVPGSPPRALRAAAGERLDVHPTLESRPVADLLTGQLASSRVGSFASLGGRIGGTVSPKDGAMTTAGKSVGRAFGTAGRSVAAAFRKAF